jgi:SAM-dependent methyltransferase
VPDPIRDATTRFSDRVEDYARYRPGYPPALIATIARVTGLRRGDRVADIGSGTGLSAEPFLTFGCRVYAVEPNDAMRRAAEHRLGGRPGFHSVNGTAEATSLDAASMDLVIAGQACHWFEPEAAHREFARILKPDGFAAIFWNDRTTEGAFMAAYEELLREYGTDFDAVRHEHMDSSRLRTILGTAVTPYEFPHQQVLDHEGVRGRLLSSSYIPREGPQVEPMLRRLSELFQRCHQDGVVRFTYTTRLYLGRIGSRAASASERPGR